MPLESGGESILFAIKYVNGDFIYDSDVMMSSFLPVQTIKLHRMVHREERSPEFAVRCLASGNVYDYVAVREERSL